MKNTKTKKSSKISTKEENKSGPKIEFNLEDGITWHDFAGLLLLLLVLIWRLLKIILYPVFWVYAQNVRLYRFIRADGQQRVMTEDERLFFESIPMVFISTGVIGGILLGILVSFQVNVTLSNFFSDLKTNFMNTIFRPIADLANFIWNDVIIGIGQPIIDGVVSIFTVFKDLYNKDPYVALIILVSVGIGVVLIWITIHEKFGLSIKQAFDKVIDILFGTPHRVFSKALNAYQKMNRNITAFLVGEKRLDTRTQDFFKKSLMYTSLITIWTFVAGIYIGASPSRFNQSGLGNLADQIIFSAIVLFLAGFICGTVIFALITRYFDLMNRQKYIAPEFIKTPKSKTSKTSTVSEPDTE